MSPQYQSDDIKDLATALAKAQSEITHAKKAAENPAFKRGNSTSTYADLPAVLDASRPALCKNGLSVIQVTEVRENGEVVMMTQLSHNSGQWIRGWYPIKPMKNDPQGFGSAMTYARRYSYSAITGVAAHDEDDDGNAASGVSTESKKQPEAIFASSEERKKFIDDRLDEVGKATTVQELADKYDLNKAKLYAMKNSKDEADATAYKAFVSNYNAKVKALSAGQQPRPVAATVDAAVAKQPAAQTLGDDEIPF